LKKLLVIFIFLSTHSFGQGEANIWYFGMNAGLDFNSGAPVALTDGMLNTAEGCASISNADGDLLFYSDGMTVYNKNHMVMPNGMWLLGNSSSTQSAIIVKQPGSDNIYYTFAVDGALAGGGGLSYSEVDMTLDGGLGDINANKNIMVTPATCEKVCAVTHTNGADFWVITRLENSNTFHSYLLTNTGLDMTPVVSIVGAVYDPTLGYLRSSPDGSMLAGAYWTGGGTTQTVEIYDFDISTGIISNNQILFSGEDFYGVEFSPNGQLLYASNDVNIVQFNLLAGSLQDIQNSANNLSSGVNKWALQLGPDEKIYVAIANNIIDVINNPNGLGAACDYQENAIALPAGTQSMLGFPTFVNSYVISTPPTFTTENYCLGEATLFVSETIADSYLWEFGDLGSGADNSSTLLSPTHVFSAVGTYTITLTTTIGGVESSASSTVDITMPQVSLGADLVLCGGEATILNATTLGATYIWQDASIGATYNVTEAGTYWVEVDVDGCKNSDEVQVTYSAIPTAIISGGDTLCDIKGAQAVITASGTPPFSISYTNGAFFNTVVGESPFVIDIPSEGTYTIMSFTDASGCAGASSGSAYFKVNPDLIAGFTFTPDEAYIDHASILFTNLSLGHQTAQWSFGDGGSYSGIEFNVNHVYEQPGDFLIRLIVSNQYGCYDTLQQELTILPYPFFVPNAFTPVSGSPYNNVFGLSTDKLKEFQMVIYDRWGAEIYRTIDVKKPWNGTKNNESLPIGVYTYHIKIIDLGNSPIELVGTVTLMR
jgi:gliding motility-associated-like protein